jgi:hypothetical protein
MNSPRDDLKEVLAGWRVVPPRRAGFRAQVWARLQAVRAPATWPAYMRGRAGVVAGGLALAVVLGAVGGRAVAGMFVMAERERIASAYVQGLDARTMRMP